MTIKTIDPITAHEWLSNQEAIVIDVREPAEYKEVHIAGAHLIPVGSIAINQLPATAKNKKIIIHCKFGKRGGQACEKLLQENQHLEIYNIEGGITAWENAGFPVEKNAPDAE